MPATKIDLKLARKVLAVVDAGLIRGLGLPKPGKMCVEAAVCYAMGLPHSDKPTCVASAVREFKIRFNDSNWSSDQARAKGMRRLALIQLGTEGVISNYTFAKNLAIWATDVIVPRAAAASVYAADASAYAAAYAARASVYAADDAARAAVYASVYAADAADAADAAAYAYAAAYAARASVYAADAAAYAYAAAYAAADAAASVYAARDKSLAQSAEEVVQILVAMKAPGARFLKLAPLED